jgi:hypothetical protein
VSRRSRNAPSPRCAISTASPEHLTVDAIQLGLIELSNRGLPDPGAPTLLTRKSNLHSRTPRQAQYLKQIQEHDITFGIGPAGTGKTYLAVASAVDRWIAGDGRAHRADPARRSRRASGWVSCRATWRRRWTPICARSTTRCTN